MEIGVRSVVITDTQTMIGYRKSLMTPRLIPRVATINENSPICIMLNPPRTAVYSVCPDNRMPEVDEMICPAMTTRVMMTIYPI